jgi:methionyl-tRNA formyltransferase
VFQPVNFKDQADVAQLAALSPDLLLVAAYGLILPQSVLDIPRLGAINVHASLLPEYRGAAPIQRAIMDGRPVTGITIMQMAAGLDTGDILLQRSRAIGIYDTAQTLHDELAEMGGKLLVEALARNWARAAWCAFPRTTPKPPMRPSCPRKRDASTGISPY